MGGPARVLGRSSGVLGLAWGVMGGAWCVLGVAWSVLGGPWEVLGNLRTSQAGPWKSAMGWLEHPDDLSGRPSGGLGRAHG